MINFEMIDKKMKFDLVKVLPINASNEEGTTALVELGNVRYYSKYIECHPNEKIYIFDNKLVMTRLRIKIRDNNIDTKNLVFVAVNDNPENLKKEMENIKFDNIVTYPFLEFSELS